MHQTQKPQRPVYLNWELVTLQMKEEWTIPVHLYSFPQIL